MNGNVLVLGGRSEIGQRVAHHLVRSGHRKIVLAARRSDDLVAECVALRTAGATTVETAEFDADDVSGHRGFLEDIRARFGELDVVVTSFGILGDQRKAESDSAHALEIVHTDYVAQVGVLTELAQLMRQQGHGRLIVFSSVAGVRVRRANYVYGSAKAGLDGFASGLADALAGTGVRLLVVRPGFVIGRMTAGMRPAPLSSNPDQVAEATVAALRRGRCEVWVPWGLRPLFGLLRLLPRWIWRRMPR